MQARNQGAVPPSQSGVSWSSRGTPPLPLLPEALGSGVRGGKRRTTCPSLRWLAPCCWHQPPSHFQFARLGLAMGLQEPQRVSVKHHSVCEVSMREDPRARAPLSQRGVAHQQHYSLPGRPRRCRHLPRTPTAATCVDSLQKVGAQAPGGWAIFLPISTGRPRSRAAPWWHVASTAACTHHCCCQPRGDLCTHPRASQQTNPTAHIHQQQQTSTSGLCRG